MLHIGDAGTKIIIVVEEDGSPLDISLASEKVFRFTTGSGTALLKNASFVTDGSDGELEYTFLTGELSIPGMWYLQAKVVMPTGTWYTSIVSFMVEPNLTGW